MTDKELREWSRAIADACRMTGMKPEQVVDACRAYAEATNCPECGGSLETNWAWCPECAEWREL